MEQSIKSCDVCGERQLSANSWLRFSPKPRKFTAYGSKEKLKAKLVKDACGRACLLQAFNTWLGAVHVNAPAEVKKDETP